MAIAVTSLVGVWSIEFDVSLSRYFYGLVFFATISGYNFVKYAKAAGLHHGSLTNSLQIIQNFSFISFAVFVYCVFKVEVETILGGISLCLLTFFYAVPFFRDTNLRTMAGLKVFIVAFVWAGVTTVLPALESQQSFVGDGFVSFIQHFLMVLVLMIPFEIRDLQFDDEALDTMPQKWGVRKTKKVGVALLLVIGALEAFKDVLSVAHILALLITCALIFIAVLWSRKQQSVYFAAFWVEGIPILYFILLLLFRHLLF